MSSTSDGASFSGSFNIKPSSYFYATAECYLNTFTTADWFGFGKIKYEGADIYIPNLDVSITLGIDFRMGAFGGNSLIQSPACIRIEGGLDSTEVNSLRGVFHAIRFETGMAELDESGIIITAEALEQLNNLAARFKERPIRATIGGNATEVTPGPKLENPPAPTASYPFGVTAAQVATAAELVGSAKDLAYGLGLTLAESSDYSGTETYSGSEGVADGI